MGWNLAPALTSFSREASFHDLFVGKVRKRSRQASCGCLNPFIP